MSQRLGVHERPHRATADRKAPRGQLHRQTTQREIATSAPCRPPVPSPAGQPLRLHSAHLRRRLTLPVRRVRCTHLVTVLGITAKRCAASRRGSPSTSTSANIRVRRSCHSGWPRAPASRLKPDLQRFGNHGRFRPASFRSSAFAAETAVQTGPFSRCAMARLAMRLP